MLPVPKKGKEMFKFSVLALRVAPGTFSVCAFCVVRFVWCKIVQRGIFIAFTLMVCLYVVITFLYVCILFAKVCEEGIARGFVVVFLPKIYAIFCQFLSFICCQYRFLITRLLAAWNNSETHYRKHYKPEEKQYQTLLYRINGHCVSPFL